MPPHTTMEAPPLVSLWKMVIIGPLTRYNILFLSRSDQFLAYVGTYTVGISTKCLFFLTFLSFYGSFILKLSLVTHFKNCWTDTKFVSLLK